MDFVEIRDHAKANYCPVKIYGDGVEPATWHTLPRIDPAALPAPRPPPPEISNGPGDVVKIVLASLNIHAGGDCGCESMRQQMNGWGYWGCWRHRAEIEAWFRMKAKDAGIELSAAGLWRAIRKAWREKKVGG